MKKLPLLIILAMCISTVEAQLKVNVPTEFYRNQLRDGDLPENVEGTPYFNEKFVPGEVYIKDNEPFTAMLRYDAFRDNLETQNGDKFSSLLKRNYISAKIGNERVAIFKYLDIDKNVKEGYFTQLTQGPIVLLKKKKKVFKPAETNSSTYKPDQPARLVDEIDYYLAVNNSTAEMVKLRKKNILKSLSDFPNAEKIVKQRNLKLTDENEVIQLVQLLKVDTNNTK